MDFGRKYYKFSHILLLSVGLWPYEQSALKQIKIVVAFVLLVLAMLSMIMKIIISEYDMMITLKVLWIAIPCLITIIKYITFLLISKSIMEFMELIQSDWNILKDTKEIEIMRKHAHFGWLFSITLSVFGCMCVLGILLLMLLPIILDVTIPLNVSRERKLPIEAEYFIDKEQYFNMIFCHILVTIIISITVIIGTESLYISYVCHISGMFKITCYRLQHAFEHRSSCTLQVSSVTGNATVYARIIEAIDIHKRAIEFLRLMWSKLWLHYFILQSIGIVSLSITLYRILQAVTITRDINEILMSTMTLFSHFLYMFCGGYIGQIVIDYSTNVNEKVYDTQWYRVPLREQKLMWFILHRSLCSCKLDSGFYVFSLEGFTTILATSMSYFTMLSSVQM